MHLQPASGVEQVALTVLPNSNLNHWGAIFPGNCNTVGIITLSEAARRVPCREHQAWRVSFSAASTAFNGALRMTFDVQNALMHAQ